LAHCYKADPAYGTGVAKALGIDPGKVERYAKMSFQELVNATTEEAFS
jgi:catalase